METDYINEEDPYGLEIEALDSLKPGDVAQLLARKNGCIL